MSVYADHRFNRFDTAQYSTEKPIGRLGRRCRFWARVTALEAYPGYYLVAASMDYEASRECTTRFVHETIRDLEAQWMQDMTERFCRLPVETV